MAVAVSLPVHDIYSYSIPAPLAAQADVGKRALVPFGGRTVTGYLIGPARGNPTKTEILNILDILDERPLFPEAMLPFFEWIANYYLHPIGQVIGTALPAGLNRFDVAQLSIDPAGVQATRSTRQSPLESRILEVLAEKPFSAKQLQSRLGQPVSWALINQMQKRGWISVDRHIKGGHLRPKTARWVALNQGAPPPEKLSARRQAILDALKAKGDQSVEALKAHARTAPTLVRAMEKANLVTLYEKTVYRDPFGEPIEADTPPSLTEEQRQAISALTPRLENGFSTVVLAGVTGSGKTEVYLRLTQAALDKGLNTVVLVPEIALISQTERRFRARFGQIVAVLHSGLSRGERYDQWRRIANGRAKVAIGARSCVFAPFDQVGLLIVDEEHDGAYKQEGGLSYNARDLAVVRARQQNALAVLGSATPSVQSWFNVTTEKYDAVALHHRVNNFPLPSIQVVDLSENRDEYGLRRFITHPLQQALQETLDGGNQAMIFLNRRGFAAFPICTDCGEPLRCKHCDISLTLHKKANAFRCHYCGYAKAATSVCSACGSKNIKLLGMGTEKIEEALMQLFPQARVARMDRDTMTRKGSIVNLLKKLKERQIDILVGTQMIAKGHDFPGITLVGVICADLSLNFPDFRAGEQTFQLLAQVSGRAGRGDQPGKVILQTFNPDHFSIRAARDQDFKAFFDHEIGFRQALGYPPVTRMIALRLSGKDAKKTAEQAQRLGHGCSKLLTKGGAFHGRVQVMGPIEAPIPRIADRFRWQIILKGAGIRCLQRFVSELAATSGGSLGRGGVRTAVDVDPFFLM